MILHEKGNNIRMVILDAITVDDDLDLSPIDK